MTEYAILTDRRLRALFFCYHLIDHLKMIFPDLIYHEIIIFFSIFTRRMNLYSIDSLSSCLSANTMIAFSNYKNKKLYSLYSFL